MLAMSVGWLAFYIKYYKKYACIHTHLTLAYEQKRIKGEVESLEIMEFIGLEKWTGACNYV